MISFRFHLVSLVAVFMALGLGVLAGTTVLDKSIVDRLDRQTDQLREQNGTLREQIDELRERTGALAAFGEQAMDHLVGGRLSGVQVVLITQEGTDDAGIEGARGALAAAGASIRAVLSVEARINMQDEDDRAVLAEVVGGVTDDPEELAEAAAVALAERLARGPGTEDLLARLVASGFLENIGPGLDEEAFRGVGGPQQTVVVVAGGVGQPSVDPEWFLFPLVERLAEDGLDVAAVESLRTEYPFVTALRGDGAVSARIVTLDNVDETPGEVGLVLALEDLVVEGRAGSYGVKEGATRLIPGP